MSMKSQDIDEKQIKNFKTVNFILLLIESKKFGMYLKNYDCSNEVKKVTSNKNSLQYSLAFEKIEIKELTI